MSTYPNLNNKPESLKMKTRDDEIQIFKNQTEKHDLEIILKSLKIDSENYKKKYKSLNKKKNFLNITEILIGSGLAIGTSTMSLVNPGAVNYISSNTAFLTSTPILITNEDVII